MDPSPSKSPRNDAFIYFLRCHKAVFLFMFVVTLAGAAMESLSVVAFFPIFSFLLNDAPKESGGILGLMMGAAGLVPLANPVVSAAVLLVLVFLLKALLNFLRESLTATVAAKLHYGVKMQIMERY